MNMKSFCAAREHAGRCPLLRPKADFSEDSFIATDKFAENTAVALRIDGSRKNLHPGNPGFFYLRLASIVGRELAGIDSAVRQPLRKGSRFVIAGGQRRLRCSVQSDPQILITLAHVDLNRNSVA